VSSRGDRVSSRGGRVSSRGGKVSSRGGSVSSRVDLFIFKDLTTVFRFWSKLCALTKHCYCLLSHVFK
jgi:hypothetical protein